MTLDEHTRRIITALEDSWREIANCPDRHCDCQADVLIGLGAVHEAIQDLRQLDIKVL